MTRKNTRRVRVIAPYEFARYIYPPIPSVDLQSKMFAQVFREVYVEACFRARDTVPKFTNTFLIDTDTRLRTKGRIDDTRIRTDMTRRIWAMCRVLVSQGIVGTPVKTSYRVMDDFTLMSGKPDLRTPTGELIDLRLQTPNDYSRLHARLTSWVFGTPIHLVAILPDENGGYVIEREEIDGNGLSTEDIPEGIGHDEHYPNAHRILNTAKPEVKDWYDGCVV